MASFLLVHGAWHDRRCWDFVTNILRERGHNVAAPTLPGHGDKKRSAFLVSMTSYAQHAVDVASSLPGDLVCEGHSMGGMVMSQAAEMRPDLFRQLIYLTAFVPDGKSHLVGLAKGDKASLVEASMQQHLLKGVSTIPESAAKELFYHDCGDDVVEMAKSQLCPQSVRASFGKVRTTPERFGSVRKSYIECSEDKAITVQYQRELRKNACFDNVRSLRASHSPFLSMPEKMSDVLEELANA